MRSFRAHTLAQPKTQIPSAYQFTREIQGGRTRLSCHGDRKPRSIWLSLQLADYSDLFTITEKRATSFLMAAAAADSTNGFSLTISRRTTHAVLMCCRANGDAVPVEFLTFLRRLRLYCKVLDREQNGAIVGC